MATSSTHRPSADSKLECARADGTEPSLTRGRAGAVRVVAPVARRPLTAARPEQLPRHLARDALRRRMLAAADGLAVVGAALLVSGAGLLSAADGFWTLPLVPVWLLLAKLHGLYDRDHRVLRHLTVDELGALLTWSTVGTAATVALLALSPDGAPSAAGGIGMWIAVFVLAAALRGTARAVWRACTDPATAVLVGDGPLERATRRKLELFRDIHVDVAGAVEPGKVEGGDAEAIERRIVDACGGVTPDRVIVCSHDVSEALLADLMRFCRSRRVKLSVVPPLRGMFGTAVRLGHVAELPLVEYHTWDVSVSTLTLKRCFDVAVAAVALVVTAPLFLLAAIAIRLDSRGPVLYRQRRAGLHGAPFTMTKFRTMVCDADERLVDVVDLDALPDPMFKLRRDPRVTRVGRVLRRWSLDELPQLLNVLRGQMSLVGPRPESVALVERYRAEHRFRLDVMPGITGPMQVFGRGELTFDERLAIERDYIENLSLGRDLQILLHTIPTVLSGRGAF
jgi:exopolysaccharide biosynthesis polyprenyl glycosylphosphotransferase